MFLTLPEFEFHVPEPLKPAPRSRYWRAMSMQHIAAWHILTLQVETGDEFDATTLVFAWDKDLVATLEDEGSGRMLNLTSMVGCRSDGWKPVSIREVWHGADPTQDDHPCVVLVDEANQRRSGFLGEVDQGLRLDRLVARVTAATPPRGRAQELN